MPGIRRPILTLCSAAMALTSLLVTAPAHADETSNDMELHNRMDGSRLALQGDSTDEGAQAISLRSPTLQYKTQLWEFTGQDNGYYVVRNETADKCLQPSTDKPVQGTTVVVRTCDGSRLQEWDVRKEEHFLEGETGWNAWRPRVNTSIALTLDTYKGSGSWDTLHLNQDLNSTDRLWRFHSPDVSWW